MAPGVVIKTTVPPHQRGMSLGYRGRRLADGVDVRLDDAVAWCFRCDDFVVAERLPALEELRERLATAKRRFRNALREFARAKKVLDLAVPVEAKVLLGREREIAWERERLTKQESLLRWRRRRRSPPRCLECGSVDVHPLPLNVEPVPHPAGRGTVSASGVSIDVMWFPDGPPLYDEEGLRSEESNERRVAGDGPHPT